MLCTIILYWVGEKGIVCIIFGIPNKGTNISAALTLFLKKKDCSIRIIIGSFGSSSV